MLFHSREVSLSITNLTSSDSGEYYIALMLKNEAPVESEKISLLIHSRETITGTPSTSSASTRHSFHEPSISASSARLYIITALVVIAMVMPIVLINWFCLNQGNKSDTQQPQISGPKCAVTSEASSSKPVCSIEYVMLDFRNRPGGKEGNRWSEASLKPQDSVEYATITFHPTQPGPRVAQEELNTPTESISRMSADTSVIRHNVRRL
ncbi:hypothetical protein JZ751_025087 [Albula glossodonta]|uniref:Uncharacterized protein n=1 Tax=Albula glossodonta TaxID=121402 RepID=A0A8T2PHK4_9TELE|nr:hypothetical protein JZ751_025087 [Albula glossodonta]